MSKTTELIPTARLFAMLLLRELDDELLQELRQPDVAAALQSIGITLPEASQLEDLRATFFATFLHPTVGAPPVQSLWADGQYEGESTLALRKIAEAAGFEFERDAAQGAPEDHLGCVLLLWCACAESKPDLAALLVEQHLDWVERALAMAARSGDFYGQVVRATVELIAELRTTAG